MVGPSPPVRIAGAKNLRGHLTCGSPRECRVNSAHAAAGPGQNDSPSRVRGRINGQEKWTPTPRFIPACAGPGDWWWHE